MAFLPTDPLGGLAASAPERPPGVPGQARDDIGWIYFAFEPSPPLALAAAIW